MPTILDATVANGTYYMGGNGGRRLVRLDNGTLVSIFHDDAIYKHFVKKSTDNGSTWVDVCFVLNNLQTSNRDTASLVAKGNTVFLLWTKYNASSDCRILFNKIDVITQSNVDISSLAMNVDLSQNATGNVSLTINEAKTELHATWASKNATYPNSFNIRYAKGTIATDGSVAWGAVVQLTSRNASGSDYVNPSIVIDSNGKISILSAYGLQFIISLSQNSTGTAYNIVAGTGFGSSVVYDSGFTQYAQSSPSAIFVPQSINGLANGRIWVAWHGLDATDATAQNIRVSYSDDGGVTWSAMQKLTSGNIRHQMNASLTFNKSSSVFILFDGIDPSGGSFTQIRKMSYNGSWSGVTNITNVTGGASGAKFPSTLLDSSVSFTEPLFIYLNQQTSKVGFYGTWTVTTISVTQGSIGQKTDKANVLTYAITTDGTMSTITEKVNGVTVGTKTATSGQSLIAGLTQAQWDDVAFGRYRYNPNLLPTNNADWEQGSYSNITVGGTPSVATSTTVLRIKSAPITVQKETVYTVKIATGYQIYLFEVNSANVITQSGSWLNNNATFTTTGSADKLYILVRKSDTTTIVATDITLAQLGLFTSYSSNTLTIEMGTEIFTYTFDKRPASDADMLSVAKAVQDSANTYLPAVKSKLGTAIRAKGGTVLDTDSLEVMASAVSGMPLKRYASGNTVGSGTGVVTVSGLPFTPSSIILRQTQFTTEYQSVAVYTKNVGSTVNMGLTDANGVAYSTFVINSSGFTFTHSNYANDNISWIAYE